MHTLLHAKEKSISYANINLKKFKANSKYGKYVSDVKGILSIGIPIEDTTYDTITSKLEEYLEYAEKEQKLMKDVDERLDFNIAINENARIFTKKINVKISKFNNWLFWFLNLITNKIFKSEKIEYVLLIDVRRDINE